MSVKPGLYVQKLGTYVFPIAERNRTLWLERGSIVIVVSDILHDFGPPGTWMNFNDEYATAFAAGRLVYVRPASLEEL